MRVVFRVILIGAAMLGGAALADPNPQLVASVENRLTFYGLRADVSKYATSTVAQLHFALSSPKGYFRTKRELRAILRGAKYKQGLSP